jgi:hypothetical protein
MKATQQRIVKSSLWMVFVSVGLFFLPALNGLIAGLIGGRRAGNVRRSLLAALAAGVVVAVATWLLLSLLSPRMGAVAGVLVFSWIVASEAGLLTGAALGGMRPWREA